jgi:hypothetical protein
MLARARYSLLPQADRDELADLQRRAIAEADDRPLAEEVEGVCSDDD